MPKFPVWKQIVLGTDRPTDPVAELERHGLVTSYWTRPILAQMPFATEPTSMDLVALTVSEMGFFTATTPEILGRASESGLKSMPIEAAYRLRLVYDDRSAGEAVENPLPPLRLYVDQAASSDEDRRVFQLYRGEPDLGRCISANWTHSTFIWRSGDLWIFAQD